MLKKMAVVALVALGMVACSGDDDEGTGPQNQDELVGTWVSSGANIAPGLRPAPFRTKEIRATFNANNTYTVLATDSLNATITYTGTWTSSGTAGAVRAITLNQSTPTQLTSTGIFQVTTPSTGAKTMKYEVIQTTPAIQGFLAPTVTGGFGSTSYNGVPLGAYWVQNYVRL